MAHYRSATNSDRRLKEEMNKQLRSESDPIKRLSLQCLKRGAAGIKGLGRAFRIMDDSGNNRLEFPEFKKALHDYGVDVSDEEAKKAFETLDKDGSGTIDYEELLIALRPMNKSRIEVVKLAFQKMDNTGDNVVTVDDVKRVYNVRKHPKYVSGEMTEEELLKKFLAKFEIGGHVDGKITEEEFINYYSGISASIDNDPYFDLMIRNAWKL